MELIDSDGDRLQFLVDANGVLRQYVNGELEIEKISVLEYSVETGTIRDETGVFTLIADRTDKALGLRALAARAGVIWRGDEPAPATKLTLIDTDGDELEFSLTDAGKMQEKNNGQVEIAEVQKLHFNLAAGLVTDDTGEFILPPKECIEKAAVLRSIAKQAGVEWSGDEPDRPMVLPALRPAALDIENCASDWEFQCPKKWESLSETDRPNERFCDTCKEIVFFCSTEQELATRVGQRRCVAFDIRGEPAAEQVEGPKIMVRVALLSGAELPGLSVSPLLTGEALKGLIAPSGIPVQEQRLLFEGVEIPNDQTLASTGITSNAFIQLARVPPPPTVSKTPVRKMGKRVARRG